MTTMRRRWAAALGAVFAALLLVAGCGGGGGSDDATADEPPGRSDGESVGDTTATTTSPHTSWVAQAKDEVAEVAVYADPDDAEPSHRLANPTRVDDDGNRVPLVFLVDGTPERGEWLPVHLPVPPNGTTGFVRSDQVDLVSHDYRITVDTAAHELTLTKGGETVIETAVGLGRAGRETPTGLYFITELLEAPDPGGIYGPFAYGISGFQDDPAVRAEFGGEAVIGIHGTNEPELLGTAVSSGCIRVANDVITEMAGMLPLGVPVEIVG